MIQQSQPHARAGRRSLAKPPAPPWRQHSLAERFCRPPRAHRARLQGLQDLRLREAEDATQCSLRHPEPVGINGAEKSIPQQLPLGIGRSRSQYCPGRYLPWDPPGRRTDSTTSLAHTLMRGSGTFGTAAW